MPAPPARDHDLGRPMLPERLDRGAHARARGEAVVDEDDGLAGDVRWRPPLPVGVLPAQQIAALLLGHPLDDLRRDIQAADNVVVEHDHAAAGDRAHRQLLAAGNAELADQEDVERSGEGHRHLVRHRHAAPR
jgi:hypothetical protein